MMGQSINKSSKGCISNENNGYTLDMQLQIIPKNNIATVLYIGISIV